MCTSLKVLETRIGEIFLKRNLIENTLDDNFMQFLLLCINRHVSI